MVKHILVVYASAGGGHKSVAEALSAAVCAQYGKDINVELIDILDAATTPRALSKVPELYPKVSKVPEVYNFIYNITNGQLRNRFILAFNWLYGKNAINKFLADRPKPDLIITTFSFIGSVILNTYEDVLVPPPVVTIVTDWGEVHSSWFDQRTAEFYVPTSLARQSALDNGISSDKVSVVGYPTDKHFVAVSPDVRKQRRIELGIADEDFAILLFGSSVGTDEISVSAKMLHTKLPSAKYLAITGRNEILEHKLTHILPPGSHVYGFIDHDQVAYLMSVADVLISKSGGATISEAIDMNLPIVTFGYALEQERENTEFVVTSGIGLAGDGSDDLSEKIIALHNDRSLLAKMRTNCAQIARPKAASDIAESLGKYL